MATDVQLSELLGKNADLFAAYEEWANGQIMLLAGTIDDPNSFNEVGGKTGALGYYPVVNVSGQTIYVACIARLKAIALGGANAAVLEGLVGQVGGKLASVDAAIGEVLTAGSFADDRGTFADIQGKFAKAQGDAIGDISAAVGTSKGAAADAIAALAALLAAFAGQSQAIDLGVGADIAIRGLFRLFAGDGLRVGDTNGNTIASLDANGLTARLAPGSVGMAALDDSTFELLLAMSHIRKLIRFTAAGTLEIGDPNGNYVAEFGPGGLVAKLASGSIGVGSLDDMMLEHVLALQRLRKVIRFSSAGTLQIGDPAGNYVVEFGASGMTAKLAPGSIGLSSFDDTTLEALLSLQHLRKLIRYSPTGGLQFGDPNGNYVTLLGADGKLSASFTAALQVGRANLASDVAGFVTDTAASATAGTFYSKTIAAKQQIVSLNGEGVEAQLTDGTANEANPMLVGQSLRITSDRDGGTMRSMRMLATGKSLVSGRGSAKVRIVVGFGQSLSNGTAGGSAAFTAANQALGTLMFNGGVRLVSGEPLVTDVVNPANIDRLVPLAAQVATGAPRYGQTIVESCCARMWSTRRIRTVGINAGVGGQQYNALKKGTVPWSNMVTGIARAVQIIKALGWESEVVILFQHGEADAGVSRAVYTGYLNELVTNANAEICPITGQSAVHVFSAQSPSLSQSQVPLAQWLVGQVNPLYHCIGPAYNLTYSDTQHGTSVGYHWLGEEYDRAIKVVLDDGGAWKPMQPVGAALAGSTITVTCDGFVGGPAANTALVAAIANKGIEYTDDASPPAVVGVAVTATGFTVDLAAVPTGTVGSRLLRGAWTRPSVSNPLDPARTNICDADPLTSTLDGRALPKWLVNFELAVN